VACGLCPASLPSMVQYAEHLQGQHGVGEVGEANRMMGLQGEPKVASRGDMVLVDEVYPDNIEDARDFLQVEIEEYDEEIDMIIEEDVEESADNVKVDINVENEKVVGIGDNAENKIGNFEGGKLSCIECDLTFTRREALESHKRSKHNHPRLQCHIAGCPKGFTSASNLYAHQRAVHYRYKPYACSECGDESVTFTRKEHLDNHMRAKHGHPKLRCSVEDCPSEFCYRSERNNHIREVHRGAELRNAVCLEPGCGKRFKVKRHLKEHGMAKHGHDKIQCHHPNCGKLFCSVKSMTMHMKLKHMH